MSSTDFKFIIVNEVETPTGRQVIARISDDNAKRLMDLANDSRDHGLKSNEQLYMEMIERLRIQRGCPPKDNEQVLFHHAWGGKFRGTIQINHLVLSCDLAAIVPTGLIVGWEPIPDGYVSPFRCEVAP